MSRAFLQTDLATQQNLWVSAQLTITVGLQFSQQSLWVSAQNKRNLNVALYYNDDNNVFFFYCKYFSASWGVDSYSFVVLLH